MRKIFSLFVLLATLLVAGTGCLKDKGFEDQEYGIQIKEVKGVALPQAASSPVRIGIVTKDELQTVDGPYITLEQGGVATSDVHIKLQINDALVTANSDLTLMPANLYNVTTLDVVIPAGQSRSNAVKIRIPDASTLDPNLMYGIGFTITQVDAGYQIVRNQKNVVIAFPIKNIWDGTYDVDVTLTGHATASGDYQEEIDFTTFDPSTIETNLGIAEIFAAASRLFVTINPDNTLTISSNATAILPTDPTKNYYDPATQTFHFDYGWSTRRIVGTAVRK